MKRDDINAEPTVVLTTPHTRKLWYLVWIGVVWSFIYTSISLTMMLGMSRQLQDTCESRQDARTAIRSVLFEAPYLTEQQLIDLDLNLPAKVDC